MPLMGLLLTSALFSAIGAIALAAIPRLRIRVWSLILFVLSEYAGAAAFSIFYTPRFATPDGQLTTRAAVLGYFAGVFSCAIIAGTLVVWLATVIIDRYAHGDGIQKT